MKSDSEKSHFRYTLLLAWLNWLNYELQFIGWTLSWSCPVRDEREEKCVRPGRRAVLASGFGQKIYLLLSDRCWASHIFFGARKWQPWLNKGAQLWNANRGRQRWREGFVCYSLTLLILKPALATACVLPFHRQVKLCERRTRSATYPNLTSDFMTQETSSRMPLTSRWHLQPLRSW